MRFAVLSFHFIRTSQKPVFRGPGSVLPVPDLVLKNRIRILLSLLSKKNFIAILLPN